MSNDFASTAKVLENIFKYIWIHFPTSNSILIFKPFSSYFDRRMAKCRDKPNIPNKHDNEVSRFIYYRSNITSQFVYLEYIQLPTPNRK